MAPSTHHDDHLSLVLALFIIPKYHSPSSIRSHLHQNLYLGHFHIEKELTHFQVTTRSFGVFVKTMPKTFMVSKSNVCDKAKTPM
jgi:hypothetical protein